METVSGFRNKAAHQFECHTAVVIGAAPHVGLVITRRSPFSVQILEPITVPAVDKVLLYVVPGLHCRIEISAFTCNLPCIDAV